MNNASLAVLWFFNKIDFVIILKDNIKIKINLKQAFGPNNSLIFVDLILNLLIHDSCK